MTYYLNFRNGAVGGGIAEPYLLEGDGAAAPPALRAVDWSTVPRLVAGKDVVFGVHGFNVSYADGASRMGYLERALTLPPSGLFLGVLWPGDFWLPVVNYPFEGQDAMQCGRLLAAFCDRWLGPARSVAFISHSLGGRLVLEAIKRMTRKVRVACLTAAAVDRNCLTTSQYAAALANAERVYILSSAQDTVLRLAYPAGDFVADILYGGDSAFAAALGLRGPAPDAGATVTASQIPDDLHCNHGDYLPPGGRSDKTTLYMREILAGGRPTWP